MKNEDKAFEYCAKLVSQITEMFNNECNNFIDENDFDEDSNSTAFLHALANLMPCFIYKRLTGDDVDILAFNHIANRLIMQSTSVEEKD